MEKETNTLLTKLGIPVEITRIDVKKEGKYIGQISQINYHTKIDEAIAILEEERKKLGKVYDVFFNIKERLKDIFLPNYEKHEPLSNYVEEKEWVEETCNGMFLGGQNSGHSGEYKKVRRLKEFEPKTNYDNHSKQFYRRFKSHNDKDFLRQAIEYFVRFAEEIEKAQGGK